MAKTKKIISAGVLRVEVVYDRIRPRDDERTRQAKRKAQTEAQARLNARYSWQKLELMLAANFVPGDLVVCLTYEDKHLPFTRREAEGKLRYFRQKLQRLRGGELRCVWSTESRHDNGRYHHHVVLQSSGHDLDALRQAWGYGDVHVEPLRADGERNYETLARYMCKEYPEKVGRRTWSYTRCCRKPERESFTVPDDTRLEVPAEAVVLQDVKVQGQFGGYHYVKMIAKQLPRAPRARRKHRRRLRD